jgi:hypothetical protein
VITFSFRSELARTKQTARKGNKVMAGKSPKERSDSEADEPDSPEPIVVKWTKIGQFRAAGGDCRSFVWRLYRDTRDVPILQIWRGSTPTGSNFLREPRTIRSWTIGTGKSKKSCFVFNEEYVVDRDFLVSGTSVLECKAKVIDRKVAGRAAAGISFILYLYYIL